jgi:hypothetical protein
MDRFWKAALGVAGIGAVAFFVFFSLYRQWLTLAIFPQLTQEQAFILMLAFLVLTFLALVVGVIAWLKKGASANGHETALHHLEDAWKGVNYIDCDKLIGPDVAKAGHALDQTATYWRNRYIDRSVLSTRYGRDFIELFEQIDNCKKQVPGYNKPKKMCADFLSAQVRTTYQELKKHAS